MKHSQSYLITIALISAMGGLLFGYDWVVIGGAKPFYEQFFGIATSPSLQGLAMTSALIGCCIGAVFAGKLSDRYGRKPILLLAAFLFICTSFGTGIANDFVVFNIFRFLGGLSIGLATNVSPLYIAEISPSHLRGRLVGANQLATVLGILSAQVVNWLIADPVPSGSTAAMIASSWNGQMGWRWMFWAMIVPATLFFAMALFIPESPRWLIMKGRGDRALYIMRRIGGEAYATEELAQVKASINTESHARFADLFQKKYASVLLIGIVLAVFQQWCGINVIFNYAQEIFMSAGYGVSDVLMNIVITGITNVVFTIVAMFLVDRWGRKALLLMGSIGLSFIYLLMGTAYFFHISGIFLLIIVVLAIACYAMTLAPVMWIVVSEIFPNRIRGIAMSVATFALWTACSILTYTFPILNHHLGASGTFWVYGLICVLGGIFVWRKVPETKGKSLEELEKILVK